MSWLYPEQWPGWMDHARVGGGLFDDAPGLVRTLTACWQHYAMTSGIASRVPLSPPPTLHIVFREEVLNQPQWLPLFDYATDWFRPELNGVALPFQFRTQEANTEPALPENRNFYFQVDSPQHQHLTAFFYLGQQPVGAMDLGQVNLLSDRRQFAIQRRLGMTKGSDIQTCYRTSPLWHELPPEMQQDLRYLGWTLQFMERAGEPQIRVEELPALGYLEGGELSVDAGTRLALGEALTFYQGLRSGRASESLSCRVLVVPKGVQPASPTLEEIECFLHSHPAHGDQLEVRAWIRSAPMRGEVTLTTDNPALTLPLTGGQPSATGRLLYRGSTAVSANWRDTEQLRCSITGTNQHGLAFATRERREAPLRHALRVHMEHPAIVPREQLQREWELIAYMVLDGQASIPDFDLASLTLWLKADQHPPVQVPLASVSQDKLVFRYLPRSINLQQPIAQLQQSERLTIWLEQSRTQERPIEATHGWLCQQGNSPEHPLLSLQVVDFDSRCRLLTSGDELYLPQEEELALEGHRLQVLRDLIWQRGTGAQSAAHYDLLLIESKQGPKRLKVFHRGDGWLHIHEQQAQSAPPQSTPPCKAIWLSCSAQEQVIHTPRERNPEGGPCLAFGLGFGQTNEMAQLRPCPDGYRLYRHRPHVMVYTDEMQLEVEPHHQAEGHLLSNEPAGGWMLIDKALLRYRIKHTEGSAQLDLTLVGYLFAHQTPQQLQITCGPSEARQELDHSLPHVHLYEPKRAGLLRLALPAAPPPGQRAPLLCQEHLQQTLPRPLTYGETTRHGSFAWSVWELRQAQREGNEEKGLFLELPRMTGRKRFFLSAQQGRLGYWREGSAFLQTTGPQQATPAPSYERQVAGGHQVPASALLIGTDVTQADLPLPLYLRAPSALPFALGARAAIPHELLLYPLQSPCHPVQIHRHRDGLMEWYDQEPYTSGSVLLPHTQHKSFFRCGDLLFEISRADEDLSEQPGAQYVLSLRGVAHPVEAHLAIGGPHHQTPLPILDPVPPFAPDMPIATLTRPAIHLRYEGEAIVGLQQPEPAHALSDWIERELRGAPITQEAPTPFQALRMLTESPQEERPTTTTAPPFLHEQEESWPKSFLTSGDTVDLGRLRLRYHFRTKEDGQPSIDRAPAWLELKPVQLVMLPLAEGPDHFQAPTPGAPPLSTIWIGRTDTKHEAEQLPPGASGELHLSQPFQEQGERAAKVLLNGYAPRRAAHITRRDGQIHLHIPAPAHSEHYHIAIEGKPVRQAVEILIDKPTRFHINHLLCCRLLPKGNTLVFQLEGYLLGHQQDPAQPMLLGKANRVGQIHLRSASLEHQLAMQTAVRPAHFRHVTAQDQPLQESPAPLVLQDGTTWSLVNLQQWRPPRLYSLRPPQCDRLLWIDTPQKAAYQLFMDAQAPTPLLPSEDDEGSSFAFGASVDEGSSFGFAPSAAPSTEDTPELPADEGSSFGFAPSTPDTLRTDDEALASAIDGGTDPGFSPRMDPVTDEECGTQEELTAVERVAPILRAQLTLGWLTPGCAEGFGYVCEEGGPNVVLFCTEEGDWALRPNEWSAGPFPMPPSASGERLMPLSVWRQERWQLLEQVEPLLDELLLSCGPAVFRIKPQPDRRSVSITRAWLWLPAGQVVHFVGFDPRQEHTQEGPQDDAFVIGLTHQMTGSQGRVMPIQRGHRLLEVDASGKLLHEQTQLKANEWLPEGDESVLDTWTSARVITWGAS